MLCSYKPLLVIAQLTKPHPLLTSCIPDVVQYNRFVGPLQTTDDIIVSAVFDSVSSIMHLLKKDLETLLKL